MESSDTESCLYHTGPVTALSVQKEIVLAGVGSHIYVYDITKKTCIDRAWCLPHRNIHGIRHGDRSEEVFCIFGGKCCRIIQVTHSKKDNSHSLVTSLTDIMEVEDWVWDACFLKEESVDHVALALGHNVIIRLDWRNKAVVDRIACHENSILYCATFIGNKWKDLILAAGTVYNQVLLWSPSAERSSEGHAPVINRLTGHQGVIFSVNYNNARKQICSVSDDRSIRLYQLTFTEQTTCSYSGNGEAPSTSSWQSAKCELLLSLFGHSARVWDVKLLSDRIVSVGEDSTCCVWHYQGQIMQKFKGHKGKSIWSLAVDYQEKFVVTGGGDTSIRLWWLSEDKERTSHVRQTVHNIPSTKDDGDFPRNVAFLSDDCLVTVTNNGKVLSYSTSTGDWNLLMDDTEYKSYVTLAVSPYSRSEILLGNISGQIKLLVSSNDKKDSIWEQFDWCIHSGKIFSLHWLLHDTFLTTGPEGEITMWKLIHKERAEERIELDKLNTYNLPTCKHRWVSGAAVVTSHDLLVCGDRGGTVHVYPRMPTENQVDKKQTQNPVQSFVQIHGKAAVTDVRCYGDEVYTAGRDGHYRKYSIDNGALVLLTSCRVYKGLEWIGRLELTDHNDVLIYGFHSSDFVLWSTVNNQKLIQVECGGGHRTWDCCIQCNVFNMVHLKARDIVLSQADLWKNQVLLKESFHGRELTSVRYVCPFSDDGCVIVTASEDTSIQVSILSYNDHHVMCLSMLLPLQGHISNVRTLSVCTSGFPQCNRNRKLIFSGGGRAQVIVWRLTFPDKFCSMEQRKLCYSENLCNFILGQNVKHFKTRSWKLQQRKPNPETRFMDLKAVQLSDVFNHVPSHLHVLCAACSDGFVRFFLFDENLRQLYLITENEFHNHCVLKVIHLTYKHRLVFLSAATDGKIALWDITSILLAYLTENYSHLNQNADSVIDSASHDQNLPEELRDDNVNDSVSAFDQNDSKIVSSHKLQNREVDLKDSAIIEPVYVETCHQSGINALHVRNIIDSGYLIASGGDDNALCVIHIKVTMETNALKIQKLNSGCKLDAHSTQVTGVHILSPTKILSVSIDQRLCTWNLHITPSEIKIENSSTKCINVSDVQCMDVKEDSQQTRTSGDQERSTEVLIAGQGLSYYNVT